MTSISFDALSGLRTASSSSLAQAFEAVVDLTPSAIAVQAGGRRITYARLDALANRIAHQLRALGVGRGDAVAIMAERGPETLAAVLGAVKAGAAYAPLDPGAPAARIERQLQALRAPAVISPAGLADRWESSAVPTIVSDQWASDYPDADTSRLDAELAGDDLFAVIFTSGSTGQPKAVALEHGSMLNLLDASVELAPAPGEGALQVCAPQFDVGAYEIWATLLAGGRLVCHPPGRPDPGEVCATIVEHNVSWAALATGTFHQLVEHSPASLAGLRTLLVGGEQLLPRYVRRFRAACPDVRLWNIYGPTETTVFFCAHEVSAEDEATARVPVGQPRAGALTRIVDETGADSAPGRPGELHVGGPVLSRGYLGQPGLTAERFVEDPELGRVYRTGDLARRRDDGEIELLGRVDDQIKLRGYRVEPGEVEAALSPHPGVLRCAVVSRQDIPGHAQLVAYVVAADPSTDERKLREFLSAELPDYMVPSAFVFLPELPLTARSKVDRRALPKPPAAGPSTAAASSAEVPPTELATTIADVFAEVLGLASVDPAADFLALGGDSLLAVGVLSRLRERHQLELPLAAIFEAPTATALALAATWVGERRLPPLRRADHRPGASIPATAGQAKALMISELADDGLPYQSQAIHRIFGALDPDALQRALTSLVARHEILRTTFALVGGRWVQRIHAPGDVRLVCTDLRREADPEHALSEWAREMFSLRLDPSQLPLARWRLARVAADQHALLCLEHHVVHDGVSTARFLEELSTAYAAELAGQPFPLPAPDVQYRDFALWQAALIESDTASETLAHWERRLAGAPAELPLVFDHPRPRRQTYRGDTLRLALSPPLADALARRAREWRTTTFAVMLAAHCSLLGRYAGVEELVLGSALANRRTLASEQLLGMLVNTVPLRVQLAGAPTLSELVARTHATAIEAQVHQDLPFERVVEHLAPSRSANAAPLYQTLFSFHDAGVRTLNLPGAVLVPGDTVANGSAKADLNVVVINRSGTRDHGIDAASYERVANDGLTIVWEYNTDLFERSSAEQMLEHYRLLLEQFATSDPGRPVQTLTLLSADERERLLALGTGHATSHEPGATIASTFAARVSERPQATAVSYDGHTLTYWQLERRANRLANRLRARGVVRGTRVGVCLERSVDLILAILAITKAGGAYVPLDPEDPPARLRAMLERLGIRLVLTHARHRAGLPATLELMCLDDQHDVAREPDTPPTAANDLSDPAYVMFTSGSTGSPKAVEVPQRAVLRLVRECDYAELGERETLLALAPPAFDASTFEIWGALLNGGRLALAPPGPLAVGELADIVAREGVTTLWLTAGMFHRVVDDRPELLGGVRQLLAGGDVLSPDHVRRALRALPADATLINGYGPTEGTTFTCTYRMAPGATVPSPVPIGRPIAGTSVYVLDQSGALAAAGVPGELWIGGDGVALGYAGDAELTVERFRPDPFAERPRAQMYRSGDRVRWRPDGMLEFLGRQDRQLKLRGFRVEPAEIEAALRAHPAVADVYVAPWTRSGERRLVAYVVDGGNGSTPSDAELRAHAGARLPAYAVPTAWSRLKQLPLTASGKLDVAALPTPALRGDHQPDGRHGSGDAVERRLAAIWERVLDLEAVGLDHDFFELGGHSLLAVEAFDAIEREFGTRLPLATIFETPTIRRLAAALREDGWDRSARSLVTITATGRKTPMFFVSAGDGNSVGFGALARRLGPEQPFYALQPRGVNGLVPLQTTVEQLARTYIRAIRRVRRYGPYLLGGRCLGAFVAYEMARRFEAAGEPVSLLAVLDSAGPLWRPRPLGDGTLFDEVMNAAARRRPDLGDVFTTAGTERLLAWLAEPLSEGHVVNRYLHELYRIRPDVRDFFPDLDRDDDAAALIDWAWSFGRLEHELCDELLPPPSAPELRAQVRQGPRLGHRTSRLGPAWRAREAADLLTAERRDGAPFRRRERIRTASNAAAARYRAGAYGGEVTLIRSKEYSGQTLLDHWYGVDAGGIVELRVPGTHRSMMREPDVAGLADCVRSLVDSPSDARR